jgi:hypothetical protein
MSYKIEGDPLFGWLIIRQMVYTDLVAGSVVLKDEHYYVEIMWLGSDLKFKTDSWECVEAYVQGACEVLNRTHWRR